MPFANHENLITPPDETVIWRYMDLPKLLSLLEQRALYFALVKEFPDAWEGMLPPFMLDAIAGRSAFGAGGVNMYRAFSSIVSVNCWYQGISESVAMWSLYTREPYGTAVRSSVGRFKKAVRETRQQVLMGGVRYDAHDATIVNWHGDAWNALGPLMCKRRCYEHEHELRAVALLTLPMPSGLQEGEEQRFALPKHGQLVRIDLTELIEEVVLGPHFPEWAQSLLSAALARASLAPPVRESQAYALPPI